MYNNTLPTGMTGSTLLRNRCVYANAADMCVPNEQCMDAANAHGGLQWARRATCARTRGHREQAADPGASSQVHALHRQRVRLAGVQQPQLL
jgi:hypothetical protein